MAQDREFRIDELPRTQKLDPSALAVLVLDVGSFRIYSLFIAFTGVSMSIKFGRFFLVIGLAVSFAAVGVLANGNNEGRSKRLRPLSIKVTPWGPTQADVDAAIKRVERSQPVQNELRGTKYRQLEFEYLEDENKSGPSTPPTRFRVLFYDYTNDRSITAESDFAGKDAVAVREVMRNPVPNDDELAEAESVLRSDGRFAARLKDGSMKAFPAMPPTTILGGTTERLVNVGVRMSNSDETEVVSVSLKRGVVVSYESKAPPQSKATAASCGLPSAHQSTTANGTAGQYTLSIADGQTTLWEMIVIRPSASSGTNKSGIEVRDVKYRGKSVLKRGHVPVLNVQYTPPTCGPYRDWQWQEDMFQTPDGSPETSPGIKVLAPGQIAQTMLESGTDTGNFRGVAIYQQVINGSPEVVLVTEMQAGWYRYMSEWRFDTDGTIRPRYGYGASTSSCVCDVHIHHAYWRFDFDVVNPNNKVFQVERGRKFLQPVTNEMTRVKNIGTNRSLLVQNSTGDEAYMVVPNITDGIVDTYGVSDFWVLKYKTVANGTPVQNEIDDGQTCINCTNTTGPINLSAYTNNENVVDQDVVVWYGAHFVHNDGARPIDSDRRPEVLTGSHVIGPDLRPVRW